MLIAGLHATYILGLSQGDIDDVADFYDIDAGAQDELEAMMTAPLTATTSATSAT